MMRIVLMGLPNGEKHNLSLKTTMVACCSILQQRNKLSGPPDLQDLWAACDMPQAQETAQTCRVAMHEIIPTNTQSPGAAPHMMRTPHKHIHYKRLSPERNWYVGMQELQQSLTMSAFLGTLPPVIQSLDASRSKLLQSPGTSWPSQPAQRLQNVGDVIIYTSTTWTSVCSAMPL